MEGFGSSLVFVWLRLRHWFSYSLVTVQEFGLSKRLLAMPLVVRGWTASLRALPHFGIETTQEEEHQKCNSVSLRSASANRERRFLTGHHQPGAWCSDTPFVPADDWQLCGWEFSTGMTGVRDQREGLQGAGQILAPERTNSNTFLELHVVFLKQERGYIFLHFFLSLFLFWRFWSCLWESPSEVSIHIEETF